MRASRGETAFPISIPPGPIEAPPAARTLAAVLLFQFLLVRLKLRPGSRGGGAPLISIPPGPIEAGLLAVLNG